MRATYAIAALVGLTALAAPSLLTITNTPIIFDTSSFEPNVTNFFVCEFRQNGNLVCKMSLSTNTSESRLRDQPDVLCTISNRVLLVSTKTTTNVVVLERIGVRCEDVPEPKPEPKPWWQNTNYYQYNIVPTVTPTGWLIP